VAFGTVLLSPPSPCRTDIPTSLFWNNAGICAGTLRVEDRAGGTRQAMLPANSPSAFLVRMSFFSFSVYKHLSVTALPLASTTATALLAHFA
jgi:hypothetical protein